VKSGWPTVRLDSVFDIARGGSPRPIDKFITNDADGLNWVKISDATASGKYIERTKEKIKATGLSKTRQVFPGDFLLTNSMSFGRPYIMATDGCVHDGWLVLRPRDEEIVWREFFYHLLGSQAVYDRLAGRASGSTVKNLNTDIVASIEIPLPPLEEQKRIAAILDKADALRAKRRQAIALLDSLGSALTEDLVMKASGRTVALGDCLSFVTSGGRNWSRYYAEKGARFIRSFDVQMNSISAEDVIYVQAPDNAEARRTCTELGDVLLTITGSRIGRVAALTTDDVGSYVSQHVAILRPMSEKINSIFLSFFLNSTAGQRQIAKWQYGQTKPGLNFDQIRSFEIPDVNKPTQDEFVSKVQAIASRSSAAYNQDKMLSSLFASLQHSAFTGQL
jgi:type I restriction enzyme, S subunit